MSEDQLVLSNPESAGRIGEPVESLARITDLLGAPLPFYRRLVEVTGSAKAALLLSQLLATADPAERTFVQTAAQCARATGLSVHEQASARRIWRERGVLVERRTGLPARLSFGLRRERLAELLAPEERAPTPPAKEGDGVPPESPLGPRCPYYALLAPIAGGANAALLLSFVVHRTLLESPWRPECRISRSVSAIQRATGLTRREQETARQAITRAGLWEEGTDDGSSARCVRIRFGVLLERLSAMANTSLVSPEAGEDRPGLRPLTATQHAAGQVPPLHANANQVSRNPPPSPEIAKLVSQQRPPPETANQVSAKTPRMNQYANQVFAKPPSWTGTANQVCGTTPPPSPETANHVSGIPSAAHRNANQVPAQPPQLSENRPPGFAQNATSVDRPLVSELTSMKTPPLPPPLLLLTTEPQNRIDENGGGGELIFPETLLADERSMAFSLVTAVPEHAQALLDELAARLQANAVRASPIGYLRALVQRAQAGTFVPELGARITAQRRRLHEEEIERARQHHEYELRNSQRADPAYQHKARARRAELQRLRETITSKRPEGRSS